MYIKYFIVDFELYLAIYTNFVIYCWFTWYNIFIFYRGVELALVAVQELGFAVGLERKLCMEISIILLDLSIIYYSALRLLSFFTKWPQSFDSSIFLEIMEFYFLLALQLLWMKNLRWIRMRMRIFLMFDRKNFS